MKAISYYCHAEKRAHLRSYALDFLGNGLKACIKLTDKKEITKKEAEEITETAKAIQELIRYEVGKRFKDS